MTTPEALRLQYPFESQAPALAGVDGVCVSTSSVNRRGSHMGRAKIAPDEQQTSDTGADFLETVVAFGPSTDCRAIMAPDSISSGLNN
jgi:hypothetical protein